MGSLPLPVVDSSFSVLTGVFSVNYNVLYPHVLLLHDILTIRTFFFVLRTFSCFFVCTAVFFMLGFLLLFLFLFFLSSLFFACLFFLSSFFPLWFHSLLVPPLGWWGEVSWHSAMSHMHMAGMLESFVYDRDSWVMYMWPAMVYKACASKCVSVCLSFHRFITIIYIHHSLKCGTHISSWALLC